MTIGTTLISVSAKVHRQRQGRSVSTPLRMAGAMALGVALLLFTRRGGLSSLRAGLTNPVQAKYRFSLDRFYPNLPKHEVNQLLKETWSRPLAANPVGGFKEAPYHGKYVTVNWNGFREVPAQGPWPPQRDRYFTIFLFGGSSAFNYGVPDDQTIAAYLQELLDNDTLPRPPRVYNFGVAFYMSTQERQLFEALVHQGTVPDVAIFLDGLNDFHYARGEPPQAPHVDAGVVPGPQRASPLFERFRRSPAGNLARRLRNYLLGVYTAKYQIRQEASEADPAASAPRPEAAAAEPVAAAPMTAEPVTKESPATSIVASLVERYYDDPRILERVIGRYLENVRAIEAVAVQAGIRPLFVWQPVPTYKYNLDLHPFAVNGFGHHTYSMFGYPLMAAYLRDHPLDPNFLWCADVQVGAVEPLYVDQVHYSGKLSKLIAECVAQAFP